jgi:hypothetical protein
MLIFELAFFYLIDQLHLKSSTGQMPVTESSRYWMLLGNIGCATQHFILSPHPEALES